MNVAGDVRVLKEKNYSDFISFEWEKLWHPQIAEPEIASPQLMQEALKMLYSKTGASKKRCPCFIRYS